MECKSDILKYTYNILNIKNINCVKLYIKIRRVKHSDIIESVYLT